MKKNKKLNNRDTDILQVLWSHTDSLSANEIAKISSISKNTVLPVLKNLLDTNYIKVDEVVLTGKTLTRKYKPTIDKEQFILDQYDLNMNNLLTHFLSKEDDIEMLPEIEELINKKKNELKNEGDK